MTELQRHLDALDWPRSEMARRIDRSPDTVRRRAERIDGKDTHAVSQAEVVDYKAGFGPSVTSVPAMAGEGSHG